jgi:hypothetical protein
MLVVVGTYFTHNNSGATDPFATIWTKGEKFQKITKEYFEIQNDFFSIQSELIGWFDCSKLLVLHKTWANVKADRQYHHFLRLKSQYYHFDFKNLS